MKTLRQPTLATLGLGNVLDIFKKGRMPADAGDLVDQIFGTGDQRGTMVISGANGIVGAGKTMQFGSRLLPYGIQIIGLDFAGAPDGEHLDSRRVVGASVRQGQDVADDVAGASSVDGYRRHVLAGHD